jgi:dUTP pyrophosphatase
MRIFLTGRNAKRANGPVVITATVYGPRTSVIGAISKEERARVKNDRIRFQMREGALLPAKAHEDDAGFDLATWQETTVRMGDVGRLDTGVLGVHLPEWAWGFIHTRSSTREKWGLEIRSSVIDTGWRGPLYLGYRVVGKAGMWLGEPFTIPAGTRLGQLVLMQNLAQLVEVERVTIVDTGGTRRGVNGFGSSGD